MFPSYDAIVGHCWEAWNRVADRPWRVMSIEPRYWVQVTSGEDITIYGNGGRSYFGQTALATLHNEPGITLGTLQASGAIKLV